MTTKKSKPAWQMPEEFHQTETTLEGCCGVLEIADLDATYYYENIDELDAREIPAPKKFSPKQREQIETYFNEFKISLLATTHTATQSDEERILRAGGFKMLQNFTGKTGSYLRLWFLPYPAK